MSDAEARMVEVVAPFWSAERARLALGLSDAEMLARRSAGMLLGVQTSDGTWIYPLFQFETYRDETRVRPGLTRFFGMLQGEDPWTVAMMTVTAADELDGLSPVEWARSGGDEEILLDFAGVLRSEWA